MNSVITTLGEELLKPTRIYTKDRRAYKFKLVLLGDRIRCFFNNKALTDIISDNSSAISAIVSCLSLMHRWKVDRNQVIAQSPIITILTNVFHAPLYDVTDFQFNRSMCFDLQFSTRKVVVPFTKYRW